MVNNICSINISFLLIFLIYFLLEDNCFTAFCCFLSNLNMNQPYIYIYPLPFEPPSHLLPHLGWLQSPCFSFLSHTANSHWLSILDMVYTLLYRYKHYYMDTLLYILTLLYTYNFIDTHYYIDTVL